MNEDWQWPCREDVIKSQRAHLDDVDKELDAWDDDDEPEDVAVCSGDKAGHVPV